MIHKQEILKVSHSLNLKTLNQLKKLASLFIIQYSRTKLLYASWLLLDQSVYEVFCVSTSVPGLPLGIAPAPSGVGLMRLTEEQIEDPEPSTLLDLYSWYFINSGTYVQLP